METIAVTGGKGGTGKSTVAILLAFREVSNGKKVLLVDCDVECPNDYLILGLKELKDPDEESFANYPRIDSEKCIQCDLCVQNCRANAIFHVSGKVPTINHELCNSCGLCWNICPQNAISKLRKRNGEIFLNKVTDKLTLITGRSIPGVRETSPVVLQTKAFAKRIEDDFDLCIIDTAAGTHCSVINALDGADEAFAVTEPTPMGAHDLRVILEVLKVLEIPSKIVINQFDIGDSKLISKVADEQHTKIEAKIPYSKKLAGVYSTGEFMENLDLTELIQYEK